MGRDCNNKGVALFISLALLILLSVAGVVILLSAYNSTNVSEGQIKRLKAISLAESGIHYAHSRLRGTPEAFEETITPDPDPNAPSVRVIVTERTPGSSRYKIESSVTY